MQPHLSASLSAAVNFSIPLSTPLKSPHTPTVIAPARRAFFRDFDRTSYTLLPLYSPTTSELTKYANSSPIKHTFLYFGNFEHASCKILLCLQFGP